MINDTDSTGNHPSIINMTLSNVFYDDERSDTVPENYFVRKFNIPVFDKSKLDYDNLYTIITPDLTTTAAHHDFYNIKYRLTPNITIIDHHFEYQDLSDEADTSEVKPTTEHDNVIEFSKYQGNTKDQEDTRISQNKFEYLINYLGTISNEEVYEDGMENESSRLVAVFIRLYGAPFLEELYKNRYKLSIDGFAFALRTIGRIHDEKTMQTSMWMINKSLYDSSPIIRDAASLALAEYHEPLALQYLIEAEKHEEMSSLKSELKLLIYEMQQILLEQDDTSAVYSKDIK